MFPIYPYLNINDLNLDYILKQIGILETEVTQFVSLNAIKYADPIQWNIVQQYEKNTVVIDPLTGTAYISVAPVPSGVALTNTDYWTVVFDLGSFVTRAAQNFTSRWESETTTSATFPSNTGEWLVWGDVLYKALTNITAGDTYVVNGNIEHFTIEDVYNAYLNTIANVLAIIGDLVDLTTSDTSDIVHAINSVLADLNITIGDLANLTTSDTSDIVNAINSVLADLNITIGDLANLTTSDTSSVVNAINAVNARISNYDIVNVKEHGATGDGITDDSAAVADALDALTVSGVLYFPAGSYKLDSAVTINEQCTVYFNNCEIICASPTTQFNITHNDVDFVGKLKATNSGGVHLATINSGVKNVSFDLIANVSGFTTASLITGVKASHIRVIGRYETADSEIVFFNGCSFVEVAGVHAIYTSSPHLGPIVFTDKDSSHTYHDIHIHDCYTDGGGVLNNGNVSVTRQEQVDGFTGNNFNYIYNVEIDHITAINCPFPTDGLDVLFCNHSMIHDVRVSNCNKGVVLMGQLLTMTNSVISECLRAGIFFGDQNMGSSGTTWSNILVSNCIVKNNGQSGTYPANFAADQPSTCYVTNIFIENCVAYGSPYVFDLGNNTGGGGIRMSGGFGAYTTSKYRCNTGDDHMFKFTNISGMNPFKFVTSPTIDVTNVTNTFPCDVFVCFRNGTTAQQLYIDDVATLTLQSGMIESFILPKGSKVRVSVDGTGCAWTWYGL